MKTIHVMLMAFLVMGVSACGHTDSRSDNDSDQTSVESVETADEVEEAPAEATVSDVVTPGMPVVIDFWAEWCGPCRTMKPIFTSLADRYEGRIIFKSVNVDENAALAERYGITAIPAFIFLDKEGNVLDRVVGAVQEQILVDNLNKLIPSNP